jgi:rod shape-determining protein MreD
MSRLNFRFIFAVLLTLSLTIVPLPNMAAAFRPPWVLMFVLYVQFYMPRHFHITHVFLLGLALDALTVSVFGEHAFALILASCLAAGKVRRFHFFPVSQQMMFIALFCLTYQLVIVLIDAFLGHRSEVWFAVGTVLVTMTFWPWVKLLADNTLLSDANC